MHILYLHQNFCPPDGIGNARSYEMARRWVQAGHRVTLVTSARCLPETYGVGQFILDGIQLVVARTSRSQKASRIAKAVGFLGFATAAIWRAVRAKDVDLIFVAAADLPTMFPGLLSKIVSAAPLVIEVAEPRTRNAAGKVGNVFVALASRGARHMVALTPGVKERLVTAGVDEDRITVIPDSCDTDLFQVPTDHGASLLDHHAHLKDGPLVVYAGSYADRNDVGYAVRLAEAMQNVDPDIRFALCGIGPARETVRAEALHTGVSEKNLWMLPALPRNRLPELLSAATAVLSLSKAGDQSGLRESSTVVFDALAAGKPTVLNHRGWLSDLVNSRGAGVVLSADDIVVAAQDLADFLKDDEALRRAGEQAAALAASRFNRDKVTSDLRIILETVAQDDVASARRRRRSLVLKRGFDLALSVLGLVVMSPVMIVLALLIWVKMGRPILFRHMRPGLGARPFRLLKFRTMNTAVDEAGNLLPDGERMTPLGRFLRRTSLDELPSLINVLFGDMSFVGPRPLLMEYLPFYDQDQARRHSVRPGITGWAQINGRNALTWEEKFAYDCWYVDNRSLWLDLKILLRTAWVVLRGKGISAPGHESMPRFDEIMAHRQGAEDV